MTLQEKIGRNLKKIRKEKKLTQAEVAKTIGMNANYYARIERGIGNPSTEMLEKLAKALKIKSSDIFPF